MTFLQVSCVFSLLQAPAVSPRWPTPPGSLAPPLPRQSCPKRPSIILTVPLVRPRRACPLPLVRASSFPLAFTVLADPLQTSGFALTDHVSVFHGCPSATQALRVHPSPNHLPRSGFHIRLHHSRFGCVSVLVTRLYSPAPWSGPTLRTRL